MQFYIEHLLHMTIDLTCISFICKYNQFRPEWITIKILLKIDLRYSFSYFLADQPVSPSKISTKKTNDFYKDANVEEVKNCYHILEELKLKIVEFLQEWPDQPTLKTVIEVFYFLLLNFTYYFFLDS